MAKKKAKSESTDAERRARQSQRLARVLRAVQCVMGQGRWDAEALAQELNCSIRTVHRILQTISMAGIPCRYDSVAKAYRVPRGFRFPGLQPNQAQTSGSPNPAKLLMPARQLLSDVERFAGSLREFCEALDDA
jgi:hypothetical protein